MFHAVPRSVLEHVLNRNHFCRKCGRIKPKKGTTQEEEKESSSGWTLNSWYWPKTYIVKLCQRGITMPQSYNIQIVTSELMLKSDIYFTFSESSRKAQAEWIISEGLVTLVYSCNQRTIVQQLLTGSWTGSLLPLKPSSVIDGQRVEWSRYIF